MAQYDVRDENGREVSMDDIPSVRILRGESAEPLLIQTVHRGSGIRRWNLLKSAPLLDEAGEVEATITIIEDVTDQHRAERHAAFLAEVSEVLASSLDYEQTLRNVAALAVPTIVDWCAVDLLEEGGERKPVAVAHVDPARIRLAEELRRYEPGQLDPDQGLGLVFRTGTSVLYERVDDEMLVAAAIDVRHLELLRAIGFRSVAIVPMRLGRRVLGAMTLVTAESARALDRSDLELAEQVAARAAVAIENSRLYSERSMIAHTLQQSLLPERLPEIAGYELASLYIPAGRSSDVGGDFYDVWQAKRSWLIVIGDVTGKGVQAATLTSLVRHTIRTASEFVSSPAALLALVDKTLKQQQHRSLCTALCIRLDGDQAAIAAGGHPLPLHISASGVMQAGAHGPILGAFEDASWRDSRLQLEPDSTLVTYTDGVTDAVGEDGTRYGLERLRTLLARSRNHSADEVIRALREALDSFQTGAHADDTAALVLHRPSSAAEISGSGEAASDRSAAAV
jgi:serine phosphatase RsbU (regulator of sigma subunit)